MKAILDSSALIEILVGGQNSDAFQAVAREAAVLVVPVITLLEVHRFLSARKDAATADDFAASLQAHTVLEVDAPLALEAARLGRSHKLAMADSLIYASALAAGATLWTQDADFKGLKGVHYLPKKA